MPYTTYCPMILKSRLPSEGRPLDSTTMWSPEHCIADRMMESSSAAYHTKRHRKYSKRLMTVCVELISLVRSLEINSQDWGIIGQKWSLTPSLTPSDATLVRSMVTLFTKHWDIFTPQLLSGHWKCGEWTWLVLSVHLIKRTSIYPSHNWLLF